MKLFEPISIKNLNLKNRAVMPPMCMYSALSGDGRVSPFHLSHYAARAVGQAGMIIVEATGIRPEGRISDQCLGLIKDVRQTVDNFRDTTPISAFASLIMGGL